MVQCEHLGERNFSRYFDASVEMTNSALTPQMGRRKNGAEVMACFIF